MNIGLWIVQGVLSLVFLIVGAMKVFAFEKYKKLAEKKSPTHGLGLSKGLVTFIGASELAGSVGLILPSVTRVAPALTAWAAIGLAIVMFLATIFHLRRHESPLTTIILFALACFVAAGRW
jgi:putative oxidoreductase